MGCGYLNRRPVHVVMLVAPAEWSSVVPTQQDRAPIDSNVQKNESNSKYTASTGDALAFGFIIVLGSISSGWTEVLTNPFGIVVASYFVAALGYLALSLCIAEISSFFAFGGGAFGYVRCIITPVLGFLIGMCELVEYVVFAATSFNQLGSCVTTVLGTSTSLEPIWWVMFYMLSLFFQLRGGRTFWTANKIIAAVSVLVLVFYFFSVVPGADAAEHTDQSVPPSSIGISEFMQVIPVMSLIFVGMEGVVLAAEDVRNPNTTMPKATLSSWLILFSLCLVVILVSATSPPGSSILSTNTVTMTLGLSHVFGWTAAAATTLSLPSLFGTPYGFLFAAGKRVSSMAASKVLPSALGVVYGPNGTPLAGLLFSSALAFGVQFLLRYGSSSYTTVVYNVALLLSCVAYVSMAYCYWVCGSRYSNLQRQFRSPAGAAGAAVCALVFALVFVGIVFVVQDFAALAIVGVVLVVSTMYYYAVVRRYEFFSDAEVNTFMKAYVINANLRRKEEIRRRTKQRMLSASASRSLAVKKPTSQVLPTIAVGGAGSGSTSNAAF